MKLLLAEDTRDLNRGVTMLLEHEYYEVDSVFDGQEALERIEQESYDGIILDIMMPRKDGMEVLQELRRRHILTPVLLLTAKAEVDDRVAGLDAGADDYLAKPFAMKELLARIRSMIRRREDYSERRMQYEDIVLNAEDFALTAGNSVRLSIKEFELMQILMANTDRTLTTEYLLGHVWNGEPDAQEDTVWLYISYLKGKLRAVGSTVRIAGSRGGAFRLVCDGE
ncbi:MAG: response regulator transcription factor [Lachnospiraceae bacterium]|nr:response regulator transcription factor [Lachnospiraceae bacterium]